MFHINVSVILTFYSPEEFLLVKDTLTLILNLYDKGIYLLGQIEIFKLKIAHTQ